MFPSGKKYFITLYKTNELFLFTCQDRAAHQNVMFQLTHCTIEVPIVELQVEKQEEERKKIASEEGICYSLTNSYIRTYYIYPTDTVNHNSSVMNGYKPKYLFLYWVDFTHESDGDININNYVLERPNLRSLSVWVDDHLVKNYDSKNGQTTIIWDQVYQNFIEWTGRTIISKEIWMNSKTIILVKIDPNSEEQVKDKNLYTIWEGGQADISEVMKSHPKGDDDIKFSID